MTESSHVPSPGRFRTILGYASLGLVLFLAITAVRGYRDLRLAKARAAEIESSIERAEHEIDQLGRRVERLRDDPAMLERLAREDLGMVKPGEVVVLLEPDPSTARPRSTENRPTSSSSSSPQPSSGPPGPASP